MYHISLNKAWAFISFPVSTRVETPTYIWGAHIIVESFVHLKQNVHNTTYAFKFAGK